MALNILLLRVGVVEVTSMLVGVALVVLKQQHHLY
jgi:hypothetical protein